MKTDILIEHEGEVIDAVLERDGMFWGGWKVSYLNCISSINLIRDKILTKKEMKDKIDYKEYCDIKERLEIKVGTIIDLKRMEGSDKMLKLSVDFGGDNFETVMTNIGNKPGLSEKDEAEDLLVGIQLPFITNLKPVKMMGVESTAMIMIPTVGDELQLNHVPSGANLL